MRDDVIEDRDIKFREKANKWNAFNTKEDPVGMCKAADYHDQWFRSKVAAFNVYYICRAGNALWPCRTVTLSNWWKKKHADPLATKQKWYCPHCEGELQDKMVGVGGVVEIVVNRVAFNLPEAAAGDENFEVQKGVWSKEWMGLYCKAELPPPQHIQDLKCGAVEQNFGWFTSPLQLMKIIPELAPIANRALQPTAE